MPGARIRVLIVDDSRIVRGVLATALARFPDFEVVGEAGDGKRAEQLVRELRPDVITLDVLMPLMGGIEAIEAIMRARPTPIVVVADLERADSEVALEAVARGAIEVFPKPSGGFDSAAAQRLADVLRSSASVTLARPAAASPRHLLRPTLRRTSVRIVGLVASTGGPRVLQALLRALPQALPCPIAIVQHTAPGSTQPLASWLTSSSGRTVTVAKDGQTLAPGQVVLAPEDRHLCVKIGPTVTLDGGPRFEGHRPSGTVLLKSLAAQFGTHCVGLVLSGMGSDGAEGAAAIEEAGGIVMIEDPAAAVLSGMPTAALARVRAPFVGSADALAEGLRRLLGREA
ncbi:MAG: chemotaxis protein CheB [Polyangia bacterium]